MLLVVGLMALNATGAHHEGRLLAIVLLLFRAAQNATVDAGRLPGRCSSRCRSSTACAGPRPATRPARPCAGDAAAAGDLHAGLRGRLLRLHPRAPGAQRGVLLGRVRRSDRHRRPLRRRQVHARADPAAAARAARRALPGQRRRGARVRPRGLAPAGGLRAPGTAAAARLGGGQHPLLPRRRRRGRRARRAPGPHPRRHHRLVEGLRHDRRPPRGRRLGRPAAAHLPGAGARGAPPGARAGRAHQRPGPALGGADPGVADGAEERADAVHDRPPHVHAGHVRPGDGDPRRAPGRLRHPHRPCRSTTTTTAPPR